MKIKEANRIYLARQQAGMRMQVLSGPLNPLERLYRTALLNLYARILKRSSENSTIFILLKLDELELNLSDVLYLLRVYWDAKPHNARFYRGITMRHSGSLAIQTWGNLQHTLTSYCLIESGQVVSRPSN